MAAASLPAAAPIAARGPLVRKFTNARVLRRGSIVRDDLWTKGGSILDPQRRFWEAREERHFAADEVVDCGGLIIAPGFIDLQINGAFGIDFSDPVQGASEEALLSVASRLLLHGVTAFCPTIITSEPRTYQAVLPNMRRRRGSARCAEVLGAHLEGPFISDSKYGAHPLALVRSPAQGFESLLQCYGSLENVAIVTIAPELKGALEAVRKLRKSGVVVSAGHSMASLREAEAAVEAGVTMITHLYNAMQPFHHRDPGLIGLLARTQSLIYYGIIADGIHSNPASVRMAFLTSREGAMIVTDAVPAMGLPEGRYRLGKQDIEILKDRVVVAGTETLAGSVANMSESVRNYLRFTGCSIAEALEAASLHPARALGIEARKGSLDFGCDADMVVLDDSLALKAVFCGGELAWMSEGALKFIRPEDEGRLLARPAPLPSPSPPPLSSSQPIDSLLAPPPAPACAGSLPLVRGSSQI